MIQHHQWSLTEIENMLPWEREVYVNKLQEHIREENDKAKQQQTKSGRM